MVAEEKKDEDSAQHPLEHKLKRDGQGRKIRGGKKGASPTSNSILLSAATNHRQNKKEDALAHLVRYETMVRQQEAEDMATLAYMKPCLERLVQLAGVLDEEESAPPSFVNSTRMDQRLSFQSLRVARQKLDAIERDASRQSEEREFLATDRQLLMVLRVLTKDEEFQTSPKGATADATTLTWAEFVQCYKVCIAGMLTLQQLAIADPAPSGPRRGGGTAEPDHLSDSVSLASLRSRTRDRTVSMMKLFGPSSTHMLSSSSSSSSHNKTSRRSKTSASSTARRVLGAILKGVAVLLLAAVALVGADYWMRHSASMRARSKPPRFVPLTALYPPQFFNTSPASSTAATRGGGGSVVIPTSTRGLLQHDAFSPRATPTHPRGIIPAPAVAGRFFPTHGKPADMATNVAIQDPHSSLSVWQHAIGGAVAMPLVTQLLFPPSVAGRFVATASLLAVAAVGIATNLLASLCARAIVKVRQWLQLPPAAPSSSRP